MRRPVQVVAIVAPLLALLLAAGCASRPSRPQTGPAVEIRAAVTSPASATPPVTATSPPVSTAMSPAAFPVAPQCAGNSHPQLVVVDIASQRAWMCAGTALVHSAAVTTGASASGDDTPTGTFALVDKQTNQYLYPRAGGAYFVHYWLPFQGNAYGFHDATWQTFPFGSPQYRTDGSHGCVHLPLTDMSWLYGWAQVGATITIR